MFLYTCYIPWLRLDLTVLPSVGLFCVNQYISLLAIAWFVRQKRSSHPSGCSTSRPKRDPSISRSEGKKKVKAVTRGRKIIVVLGVLCAIHGSLSGGMWNYLKFLTLTGYLITPCSQHLFPYCLSTSSCLLLYCWRNYSVRPSDYSFL